MGGRYVSEPGDHAIWSLRPDLPTEGGPAGLADPAESMGPAAPVSASPWAPRAHAALPPAAMPHAAAPHAAAPASGPPPQAVWSPQPAAGAPISSPLAGPPRRRTGLIVLA